MSLRCRQATRSPEGAPDIDTVVRVHAAPRLALGVLLAAQFMLIVDVVVLNVALPAIQTGIDIPDSQVQLAGIAYTSTFGSLLVVAGRAGDLLGRRRIFMTGIAVFTIASVFSGAARDPVQLFTSRALQGVGAAMVSPTALALVTSTCAEGRARHRALGLWAAVGATGAIAGQLVGGVITDVFGWRWIFFVNAPVGAAVLALAPRLFTESRDSARPSLDLAGAATLAVGIGSGSIALARIGEHGADTIAAGAMVAAVALLARFVVIERRHDSPLVRSDLLRLPGVLTGNVVLAMLAGSTAAALFFTTLYLQRVLGYSPSQVGLGFAPVTVVVLVVSPFAGRIVGRTGVRPPLVAGCALSAAGMVLLTMVDLTGSYFTEVLPGLATVALGNAIAFAPTMIAATSGVGDADQGLASGLIGTSQEVGTAIGLAVLASIAAAATRASQASGAIAATTGGYRLGYLAAAVLAALAAAIAARAPRSLGRTGT
jgi:EmrB/QacA subfamily drug resistance transporter